MGNTEGGYRRGADQTILRETDLSKYMSKNYKMKETGKNIFKTKMQESYPCSLHNICADCVNAPRLVVLSGLESGRKQSGRGYPGRAS